MASFKFDPIKHGLQKTLKEYEEAALRNIWSIGKKGMGSTETWIAVNETVDPSKKVSRASVILFLNRMVDQRVLNYRTATGKGGYHRIYYPIMDEKSYKKHIMKTIVESMLRDFPEETKETLREILEKAT